jgi:hypothetical protein
MDNKRIIVVVRGGQVEAIFGSGDCSNISVTVMDADRPAFETPEEKSTFDAMEAEIEKMEADPNWAPLY